MKKIFATLGILLIAALAYSQTSVTEIEGLLQLRAHNPQIRLRGTGVVKDYTGDNIKTLGHARAYLVTTADTHTITPGECGSVIIANKATDTQVFTLPAVTNVGCQITLIAGHAGGEITFEAAEAGTDCIYTTFTQVGASNVDTAIVADGDCETGNSNTGGTNAIGDSITLISDGVRWLGVSITSGIWAVTA